jgi:murein DD-endopeptidase MepM/ murein hydrolase activator NlpD
LQSDIKNNREILIQRGKLNRVNDSQERTLFDFPLKAADDYDGFDTYVIWDFVDQNLNYPGAIMDWNCGNRTYDFNDGDCEYWCNHRGTDFSLSPFAWHMQENESVEVVAAADGVINYKQDGWEDQNCNGFDEIGDWNMIDIEHYDGSHTIYGHLKRSSPT